MLKVAMLSGWHVHAKDYARQAMAHPEIEIVAVWDEDANRGRGWADELQVPFYEELETLLRTGGIDGVIVDTPTNIHKDVISACAAHGKHVFSEKVLALTTEDCAEIFEVVDKNNVQLMLSLPRLSDDYYLVAQDVVDRGELGTVTALRCRNAHNGALPTEGNPQGWLPQHFFNLEQCGGGAFVDLGAHSIYLSNRLMGAASAVTARLTSMLGHDVDDNSVVVVEYATGAISILETGFVSTGSPFVLELHGTKGTLLIEDRNIRLRSQSTQNKWETVESRPNPDRSPMEQWVDAIVRGVTPIVTREDMLRLTQINQAAAASSIRGERISL